MKKLMVVLAAMGFAVGVYAAEAAKPAAPAADAAKAAEIKKADTDKDGKVTVVEYMAIYKLSDADAKKADKNKNNIIEVDEFVVVAPAVKAPDVKK
ncbi:MAG: hypothetical protein WC637_11390 [Victivallales bacterium]|jgi:hypothetical protein